jgi:hypothetical protein
MDETLKLVIANIPNFAGLLLMLYWQQRRIDQLMAIQTQIMTDLLNEIKATLSSPEK